MFVCSLDTFIVMRLSEVCLLLIYVFLQTCFTKIQEVKAGPLPITIKDSGLKELKRNDVAMIFYITVTVTGQKTVRLSSSSSKCCRKVREDDQDCESIRLHGGDIGFLKPSDNRNLTLIYSNLYLHDLVGSCAIDIKDEEGNVQKHEIKFDTSLAKKGTTYIPRLMEQYYKLEDVTYCKEADENPLENCMTYDCDIRYDGSRNYYDFKGKRCTKLPKCLPTANEGDPNAIAYIPETNKCKNLVKSMTEKDFMQFTKGKPSAHGLTHAHSYPINVQCHNGVKDPKGRWCICNTGWDSAKFDHRNFNLDVQVYHMCTVWMGKMTAELAKNITVTMKNRHAITTGVIFGLLGLSFVVLCSLLVYYLHTQKPWEDDASNEGSETIRLTHLPNESDTD